MQTSTLEQYKIVEAFERYLGDPTVDENLFSFTNSVALDELEAYPEDACARLEEWGLSAYYVPTACGGKQRSFEEFVALLRSVARRDLTVAIGHGKTYLGAVAIWVGGSEQLQKRVAQIIASGEQVALGLTERHHGSDLLSSETEAEKVADGYALSGEKWLINNATRGGSITVFAKTSTGGGPRGFTLLFAEKNGAENVTYACLPKIKTHGIRGADISGISFNRHVVAGDAVVGAPGAGLEVMLKAFQLTRTVIAGLSLGAADTALRTTLDFAVARRLYGDTVMAIPHARRLLVDAFLDLLICDCVTTAIARAAHVTTEQMSLLSAIAKYFIPTTAEKLVNNLSVVLGARHYLRTEHRSGIFQKIVRDNAILSLFDGSTVVNLNTIIQQLDQLTTNRLRERSTESESAPSRVEQIFSLQRALPEFDPARLSLHSRGQDSILESLETALEQISSLKDESGVDKDVLSAIARLTRALLHETDKQAALIGGPSKSRSRSSYSLPEMFDQAERYCVLHAASSCVQMWLHNREQLDGFFAQGAWLALCLERLLARLGSKREPLPESFLESVAGHMQSLHKEQKMFSIVPLQLAQGRESQFAGDVRREEVGNRK